MAPDAGVNPPAPPTANVAAAPATVGETSPGPGRVLVNTVPSGAKVMLDGFDRGVSPLMLDGISPGAHRLSLARDGYESSDLMLDVAAGKTSDTGTVQLVRRAPASAPVASAPPVFTPPATVAPPPVTTASTAGYAPPQSYNQGPWIFPDSSSRRLSRSELSGLSSDQLYRARNEIYARHGLIFSTPKGRAYAATLGGFYHPSDASQDRVFARMNSTEQVNVELIRGMEPR
jgi:hypothetical protein